MMQSKVKGKYFAVDFDGTIVKETEGSFITDKSKFQEIEYGTVATLIDIQKSGGYVIIFTCRSGSVLEPAIQWLKEKGFTPNGVNRNIMPEFANLETSNKVIADVYLDNRSWPAFPGWKEFRKEWLPDRPLVLPAFPKIDR